MKTQERNAWLLLAIVFALIAWALTRWITHVDRTPGAFLTLSFDQQPPLHFDPARLDPFEFPRIRHWIPAVALTSSRTIVFVPTAATQSITLIGVKQAAPSCQSVDLRNGGVTALLAESASQFPRSPIAVERTNDTMRIVIPPALRLDFARMPDQQGAIECQFTNPQYRAPTFTERAFTLQLRTARTQPVLVDVSALEDVDDLRFSGGIQIPFGGERSRLLYGNENILSAEWTDVVKSEQRDIVLVIIGALSAIAAATVIEAIRPAVQSRSKAD